MHGELDGVGLFAIARGVGPKTVESRPQLGMQAKQTAHNGYGFGPGGCGVGQTGALVDKGEVGLVEVWCRDGGR